MNLKIYKLVLAAFICFAACSITLAQVSPAPPVAPVAPVNPVTPFEETVVYTRPLQDSGSTKMRKLQAQMRALSKEISDLAREQSRKGTAIAQEKLQRLKRFKYCAFSLISTVTKHACLPISIILIMM
jgi:TolA-binding protein